MKATGIVRKLDELHRLVIPAEICRTYDLEEKTPMEIFTTTEGIVIRKYKPGCIFCGGVPSGLIHGKAVCKDCLKIAKGLV